MGLPGELLQIATYVQVGEHLDTLSPQPTPVQEPAAATDTNEQAAGAENMDTDSGDAAQAPATAAAAEPQQAAQPQGPHAQRYQRLRGILTGSTPIQLYLEFLYTHNHADLQILRNMKGAVEARNSVCHSAVIFANATMHSGTTVDAFLRENLDWLSRATNWAKFNATAGLGVIHRCALPVLPHTSSSLSFVVSMKLLLASVAHKYCCVHVLTQKKILLILSVPMRRCYAWLMQLL
jgi:hypothetical protein